MADTGSPSQRDVQDIIATRMAGEMGPVAPEPEAAPTRATDPDAPTRLTEPQDPAATRPSTAAGSRSASQPDAPTLVASEPGTGSVSNPGTRRFTSSFSRLGRTRTNANLPPDAQQLDLKLQLSRPSVLADLGRGGPASIPPGIRKLIDEHGTEGRYAVDKQLAQGGMGAVLLIRDGDFQRPAAMKVMLSQHAASPGELERFLAEAQVTAQLEHPNIVPIHDLGIMEDGTVYFTMKFIEGESLGTVAKRLKSDDPSVADKARAEWTDERILLTFLKVLDGMSYAHAKGVVHRDIKPDNIMLGAHGEVLVVDWGIAKVLGRDELGRTNDVVHLREGDAFSLTREGSVMGTLYYMPPEQAGGERGAIDARSDVYALGATLYELLARRRPVTGQSAADIIAKIMAGELFPLKQARADLSDDLVAIVMKALALSPDQRYQRCADFAEDVRRYLAGQAVQARRRNLVERLGAWIQRNRQRFAVAAGVVALLAAGIGGALAWQREADERRLADLLGRAQVAADAQRWEEARDLAAQVGERPAAIALKERARSALEREQEQRELAARAAADRLKAGELLVASQTAATAARWDEARDKAKAALELAPLPAAQELLAAATARLADARRAELERVAGERKAEGDAALERARVLPPLAADLPAMLATAREAFARSSADGIAVPGVETGLAELGALQARTEQALAERARAEQAAAEAMRRRTQADESLAAAGQSLQAGDLDAAAGHIAAAQRLEPADARAAAMRDDVVVRLREREAARAVAAAQAKARETAAEALARARAAEQAMQAAAAELAQGQARVASLESSLAAQPLEQKRTLFAARGAVRAAGGRIAEQWALAEGAARTAFDALAGEPGHADAVAARDLLIALYRGRLNDARARGALPEVAAFTNLLARLGVDAAASEPGRLAIDGPGAVRITVRRLGEDEAGRLRPFGEPVETVLLPAPTLTLPAGRYELRAGEDVACVVVRATEDTRLVWAPAKRPDLPGITLRWVPGQPGFWLAEDEVTVEQYAAFLADPEVAAEVKKTWTAFQTQASDEMRLLPRTGNAPDEAVWQLVHADAEGLKLAGWKPVAKALREPVRGVSQSDAFAYCAWLGKRQRCSIRLPSLAEWRLAANGGDERRIHPWGPDFDFGLATTALPKREHPPEVGSSPADRGPFGHRDLAGSVREWVTDPGLAHDASVVGGAWTDDAPERFRTTAVESAQSTAAFSAIGFRILVQP